MGSRTFGGQGEELRMKANVPLFSVVIPVYNVAPYVKVTVESVLNQTERNFELILVNDGSTDDSLKVIRAIEDSRIRIIDKRNTGVSDTRNEGCRQALGEYIAFLDSDDYWYPDHLSEALAFFKEHPDVPWCGAGQLYLPIGTRPPPQATKRKFRILQFFEDGAWHVDSSNLVIRRDLFAASGGYPIGMKHWEDLTFHTLIGRHYLLIGTNDRVTSIYYRRPGSSSFNRSLSIVNDYERVVRTMAAGLREHPVETPLCPRMMMRELLKAALFVRSDVEVSALMDEFGFILSPHGLRRWRRFVTIAYRLTRNAGIDDNLKTFVRTTPKERMKVLFSILRNRGIKAAIVWAFLVVLYALRGVGDAVDHRLEKEKICRKKK